MDACCLQKCKCVIELRVGSIFFPFKEKIYLLLKINFPWSPSLSFPLSQLLLDAFFLLCLWLLVPVYLIALVFLFLFVPPSPPFPAIVSPPSRLLLAFLQPHSPPSPGLGPPNVSFFFAGSGLAENEEATATSGPDEAIRAGGVMEGLPLIASSMAAYNFQDAAVGSPSSDPTEMFRIKSHLF